MFHFTMASPKSEDGVGDRRLSESSDVSESEPQFRPVVTLPEVEVSTNEEDEEVLVKLRAKLYRFAYSDDAPEWKERGTGELKILQHRTNKSCRIVMRRDKTLKVCANHFITPWMELKPSRTNEKTFIYMVAADFADETPRNECLAVRFGSIEIANQFKQKFDEAKQKVASECALYANNDRNNTDEDSEESDDETKEDKTGDDDDTSKTAATPKQSPSDTSNKEIIESMSKLDVSNSNKETDEEK